MKGTFLAMTLFFLSKIAMADGWSSELTVSRVFTEATTDLIVVYTTGTYGLTPGCVPNAWIFPANTEDRRNRAYSTLLTALTTGKKVAFWYSSTSCTTWNYHSATAVQLFSGQ